MTARLMRVLWPAFLAAGVLEMLVFALVDPSELDWSGHPLGWSRQAVYTAGFFAFWAVCSAACWITMVLHPGGEEPRLQ